MSILIKGMDMPESLAATITIARNGAVFSYPAALEIGKASKITSINARSMPHGKWIGEESHMNWPFRVCNRCLAFAPVGRYCPRCGTKMF